MASLSPHLVQFAVSFAAKTNLPLCFTERRIPHLHSVLHQLPTVRQPLCVCLWSSVVQVLHLVVVIVILS